MKVALIVVFALNVGCVGMNVYRLVVGAGTSVTPFILALGIAMTWVLSLQLYQVL